MFKRLARKLTGSLSFTQKQFQAHKDFHEKKKNPEAAYLFAIFLYHRTQLALVSKRVYSNLKVKKIKKQTSKQRL